MAVYESSKTIHIPSDGTVDDRGTIDSQLMGGAKQSTVPRFVAFQIHKYLDGALYPATKDELYQHAASRGASRNVLGHLRSIRRSVYDSAADVDNELARLPNL